MGRTGPLIALAAALVGLWVLVGLGAFAWVDRPIQDWAALHHPSRSPAYAWWAGLAGIGALAVALAWRQRHDPAAVLRLLVVLAGVALAEWAFKHAGHAWPGWQGNNYPSGHAAGGATLALLWLQSPLPTLWTRLSPTPAREWRVLWLGVTALYALLAVWPLNHIPSESVGGLLLAALAVRVYRLLERRTAGHGPARKNKP